MTAAVGGGASTAAGTSVGPMAGADPDAAETVADHILCPSLYFYRSIVFVYLHELRWLAWDYC